MSPTKSTASKKQKTKVAVKDEESELQIEKVPSKGKKSVEIDEPELVGGPTVILDEKIADDPLAPEPDTDDLEGDEVGLDDDELNPFGDKWEQ